MITCCLNCQDRQVAAILAVRDTYVRKSCTSGNGQKWLLYEMANAQQLRFWHGVLVRCKDDMVTNNL